MRWPRSIVQTGQKTNHYLNEHWPLIYIWFRNNIARAIAVFLIFNLGVLWRDLKLAEHTDSLSNVHILEQYSPLDFLMQTENGMAFHVTICPTKVPYDFIKGATISLLSYEQNGNCKNIQGPGLGFIMKRDVATGKLILANLENTNAR